MIWIARRDSLASLLVEAWGLVFSIMSVLEVILLALTAVVLLAILAQHLRIPYPLLLVLGGVLLGIAPGLPRLTFEPSLVILLFIPPLFLSTSWRASWDELRANGCPCTRRRRSLCGPARPDDIPSEFLKHLETI